MRLKGGKRHYIDKCTIHEEFKRDEVGAKNDIAVIKLKEPIELDGHFVRAIKLIDSRDACYDKNSVIATAG